MTREGPFRKGDRVRLHPQARGDVFDLALTGRTATVASVEEDFEGRLYVAVLVDDDPGASIGPRRPGHRFFFAPEEVELMAGEGEGVAPTPRTILVAGIGNIFLGDDAFGVEVARRGWPARPPRACAWPTSASAVSISPTPCRTARKHHPGGCVSPWRSTGHGVSGRAQPRRTRPGRNPTGFVRRPHHEPIERAAPGPLDGGAAAPGPAGRVRARHPGAGRRTAGPEPGRGGRGGPGRRADRDHWSPGSRTSRSRHTPPQCHPDGRLPHGCDDHCRKTDRCSLPCLLPPPHRSPSAPHLIASHVSSCGNYLRCSRPRPLPRPFPLSPTPTSPPSPLLHGHGVHGSTSRQGDGGWRVTATRGSAAG